MKSIYSLPVLQRILDTFGVGKIRYVTYFQNIGSRVWRHFIETNQGDFELYSFPPEISEYAEKRIAQAPGAERGKMYEKTCHSFDRYHKLKQFTKKIAITPKQLASDMKLLEGQKIEKVFRVYGTIVQMHFTDGSILSSYGRWSLQQTRKGRAEVLINSQMHSKEKIDEELHSLPIENIEYQKFILKGNWFEVYFSNKYSFHFMFASHFPAANIGMAQRKNHVHIYDEKNIVYVKEL